MRLVLLLGRITLRFIKVFFACLFVLGMLIILLNLFGFFIPLRNPAIYQYKDGDEISLSYKEALTQINKLPTESETDYVYRLNHTVNQAIAHYWLDEGIDTYRMRVPIWENYILWWYSFKNPRVYLRYEFTDYRRALERGIGLCSEHAIILEEVLENNGINAKIIGLSGHVVASAKADGKWFILDADYGIVIPNSIEEIEQNPAIAHYYYKDTWNPDLLTSIYGSKEDNYQFDSAQAYSSQKTVDFEQKSYIYIWLIPLGLTSPLLLFLVIQVVFTETPRKYSLKKFQTKTPS